MNKSLRTLLAALAIGLGGILFAGYVSSAHEWPVFEGGWALLEERSTELDDELDATPFERGHVRLPEIEFWGMR
jgi:hypothetical protein